MDRQWNEDSLGVTIVCSPKESLTDKRLSSLHPTHVDFIQNVTIGALQAVTALITDTADGNSVTAIVEDNHEAVSAKSRPVQRSPLR